MASVILIGIFVLTIAYVSYQTCRLRAMNKAFRLKLDRDLAEMKREFAADRVTWMKGRGWE